MSAPVLFSSSDASPYGYGVSTAWWPRSVVAFVGRVSERSRATRTSAAEARRQVFAATGLDTDDVETDRPSDLMAVLQESGVRMNMFQRFRTSG